jgi:hypothetical protein
MTRRLALLAIAALSLAAAPATAQSTTTQQVPISLTIPFTFQRLYPEVAEIQFNCTLLLGPMTSVGGGLSPRIVVAQLTKGADGSVSGATTVNLTATVPTTAAGTTGKYSCFPCAWINGSCSQLHSAMALPALKLATTSKAYVEGTFTW